MKTKHLTKSPNQTRKLGASLAKQIIARHFRKEAAVLALEGNLGSGKTTFLQGLARGLGVKAKVVSPTFVILKRFPVLKPALLNFYHLDCYRLAGAKEILDLGFKKIITQPRNVVAIEWAGRVRKVLPKNVLFLKFKFVDQKTRKLR